MAVTICDLWTLQAMRFSHIVNQCRTAEEETAQLDAQAEIAPHIQDDFDIAEEALQALDVKDNPDFQVGQPNAALAPYKI